MPALVHYVVRYGVPLVFLNVFLEQIGVPVPALPTLIVAGALSRDGRASSTNVMLAAVAASLIADWIWFSLGRQYGYRVLRTVCRISLSPDSCVRETEAKVERWGMKILLFAKFIPGLSTVAPPLTGALGHSTAKFLLYDAIGAVAWAGSGVVTGRLFHSAVGAILRRLEDLGLWSLVMAGSILTLIVAWRWWQRLRFYKALRMSRITPIELKRMLDSGEAPVIVDVRNRTARELNPATIPTAIVPGAEGLASRFENVPPGREIVLYCT